MFAARSFCAAAPFEMGCFGSKEATPEEKQAICKQMAREMMCCCLEPALTNGDRIVVSLPEDFQVMKNASAALKKMAADARASPAAGAAPAAPEQAIGGMMGMIGKVANLVQNTATVVCDQVGQGVAATFEASAVVLDNAIDGVEKPMSRIGQDLIAAKKAEITRLVSEFIVKSQVEDAFNLCQGPETAISEYIIGKAVEELGKILLADVGEYIKAHDTIKNWDAAIVKYNEAVEKARQAGLADKLNLKGIQLDINQHICRQVILGLCKQMGLEETKVRQSPVGKAVRSPVIFAKVFQKDLLTYADHKKVTGI